VLIFEKVFGKPGLSPTVDHVILSLCSKQLWRVSQDLTGAVVRPRRIKSTWKSWFAWWLRCQLTTRSAGITGSKCDGQTSRTGHLFEGSSCERVRHLWQYARTIVHAVLYQESRKPRAGSVLPDALLAQQRQERKKDGVIHSKPTKLYGGHAEGKKLKQPWCGGKNGVLGLCVAQLMVDQASSGDRAMMAKGCASPICCS
jgi:hypothetical protein